jgi:lipopolysaccharide export system permease protein
MKILDKYILKNFILTFWFSLGLLTVIAIVIDVTEKVDAFVSNKASFSAITGYYVAFIPYIAALLFPLFVFIAVIFFTSRLAIRSEVIAMLNGGMSFKRFLQPYIIGGVLLSLLILWANHTIIPKANAARLAFEEKYIQYQKPYAGVDMHYRISPTEFIYLKSYSIPTQSGYTFSYEKIEGQKLREKLWADNISWDSTKKNWKLKSVSMRTITDSVETYSTMPNVSKNYNFTPADLSEKTEQKQAMTTVVLNKFIAREKQKGNPALNGYYIEKHRRSAAPVAVLILTIIGACLASHKVRGGSGLHLAMGLAISAAYIIFMQFSTTFAVKGNLSPLLSVWIPNFIFMVLGYFIFRRFNK